MGWSRRCCCCALCCALQVALAWPCYPKGRSSLKNDATSANQEGPAAGFVARTKALEKRLLIITTANSRSTVHRSAYLDYIGFKMFDTEGNVVGDFSSRGPPLSDRNFLKPDVTAPGINILAGHTPDVANGLYIEAAVP